MGPKVSILLKIRSLKDPYFLFLGPYYYLATLHWIRSMGQKLTFDHFWVIFGPKIALMNKKEYRVSQKKRPLKSKSRKVFHKELTLGNEKKCLW